MLKTFYPIQTSFSILDYFCQSTTFDDNSGKSTFPFTLGLNQFDFIDYEKMCHQIAAVVRQNKVSGIINCCSGRPEKLADRVERYIKENNYRIKLEYGAFPDRPYDSKAVWGDDKKIREILALEGEGL